MTCICLHQSFEHFKTIITIFLRLNQILFRFFPIIIDLNFFELLQHQLKAINLVLSFICFVLAGHQFAEFTKNTFFLFLLLIILSLFVIIIINLILMAADTRHHVKRHPFIFRSYHELLVLPPSETIK